MRSAKQSATCFSDPLEPVRMRTCVRRTLLTQQRAFATRVDVSGTAPAFLFKQQGSSSAPPVFESGTCLPPPKVPVQVKSRYGLPGAKDSMTNALLPDTLANPREDFPKVLVAQPAPGSSGVPLADTSPAAAAKALKAELDILLPNHGAVVALGLGDCLDSPTKFSRFMETLKGEYDCRHFMEGRSMTSSNVANLVRTGSDDHPAYTIEPHNEYMVASANRPRKLFLLCSEEPTDGGEWVITDGAQLHAGLRKDVVDKFDRLGARYEVFYPSEGEGVYNHWQENIAPTREAAEAHLKRAGCEWEWDHQGIEGSLLIHRVLPALAPHPDDTSETPVPLWFNQIHAHHKTFYKDCHPDFEGKVDADGPWPVHTKYGDGSEIEPEVLSEIRRAVWAASVAVPMTKGALLCVDNYRALHGRISFKPDTPRQSLVSIIYA